MIANAGLAGAVSGAGVRSCRSREVERHVGGARFSTRSRVDGVLRSIPKPKEFAAETPKRIQCVRCAGNPSDSQRPEPNDDDKAFMRADKKLQHLSPQKIAPPQKPGSYLEIHRRRFSVPRYRRVRSPVSSTLSICGDSQRERLTDDECGDVSVALASWRDDQSELSFYRRLIEQAECRGSSATFETPRDCLCGFMSDACHKHVVSKSSFMEDGNGSRKKITYRPYTIEDYRNLSVPQRDGSLGPDKVEIRVKREWLMRRRSYGDSVSARNRQQILQRARELKSRRVDAQKYPVHPLKDRDADSKGHGNSFAFQVGDARRDAGRKERTAGLREMAKAAASGSTTSGEKLRALEESTGRCLCELLNSRGNVEDPQLRQLRLRHFHEKVRAERLVSKALSIS